MNPSAVDLIIRVSALLGAGVIIATVLHRRSASIQNLVWSASLGGSVMLAVLVPWAPRMEIPLRFWKRPVQPSAVQRVVVTRQAPAEPFVTVDVTERVAGANERIAAAIPSGGVPSWLVWWGAGSLLVIGWGLAGRIGLVRLTRRARRVTGGPWHETVRRSLAVMGVSREVVTYVSADVGAPMTWGALRPVLLVPAESESWSEDLRKSVAAHEVAHIARNDYLKQVMSVMACALYWFHPLAWMSARRMRLTAERACDDRVLELGIGGEEYAGHLIGVARVSRELRLNGAVAIGMARPSTLEGRIVAVLDTNQSRSSASMRARRIAATAAVIILGGIAMVRPVPAKGGEPVELAPVSPTTALEVAPTMTGENASVAQGRDSTIERSLSAASGGLLFLDMNTGGEIMVRGWDEPRVLVKARLAGLDWRDIAVDIDRDGDGVRVESRFTRRGNSQSSSNAFEIMVPRRYDVRLSSSGGSLTLIGIDGRFTGHSGGGNLTLQRASGSARLTTGGGEILVTDSDLSGSVSTGGGTVRISNVRGGLRGSSGSGPVIYGTSSGGSSRSTSDISSVGISAGGSRITVGRDSDYRAGTLHIEKAGGDIDLNEAPNGAEVRTGGGDVRVGRGAGHVDASTGGGNVTVGPVAGSVHAGTGAGEVRIVVDKAPDQVIEAKSGKGRIIIELPRDFDGRLELETAHTRTHEGTARITSDWDLDRDPLTGWDDREGTARRYLRARAVLGNGNGRVIVRTVNGEIEIRRR